MIESGFYDNYEDQLDDDYDSELIEDDNEYFHQSIYDEFAVEDGAPSMRDVLPQQVLLLPVFLAIAGVFVVLFSVVGAVEILPSSSIGTGNSSKKIALQEPSIIAHLFTPEVQHWSKRIANWSKQTGIDANLIATVMQIESCGDPMAQSGAGAMGLFQVMPYHFQSGEDPFKPATNARRGLGYLQQALNARNGTIRFGFAGYNGGITGAKRPESQWSDETQRYVYWGVGIFKDAQKGKSNSKILDEWLGRGGASLCRQASERLGINH